MRSPLFHSSFLPFLPSSLLSFIYHSLPSSSLPTFSSFLPSFSFVHSSLIPSFLPTCFLSSFFPSSLLFILLSLSFLSLLLLILPHFLSFLFLISNCLVYSSCWKWINKVLQAEELSEYIFCWCSVVLLSRNWCLCLRLFTYFIRVSALFCTR